MVVPKGGGLVMRSIKVYIGLPYYTPVCTKLPPVQSMRPLCHSEEDDPLCHNDLMNDPCLFRVTYPAHCLKAASVVSVGHIVAFE